MKMLFEKNFDSMYKAIVVLANPKTILVEKYGDQILAILNQISYS